jgi:hypothetical protein
MYWIGVLADRRTYLIEYEGNDRRIRIYPDFPGFVIQNYEIRHYPYRNIRQLIHNLEQGTLKVEWKGREEEIY